MLALRRPLLVRRLPPLLLHARVLLRLLRPRVQERHRRIGVPLGLQPRPSEARPHRHTLRHLKPRPWPMSLARHRHVLRHHGRCLGSDASHQHQVHLFDVALAQAGQCLRQRSPIEALLVGLDDRVSAGHTCRRRPRPRQDGDYLIRFVEVKAEPIAF